ncbi:MAG: Pyruvate dehydrogenase E1 component subunit beta [Chlamydiales bacterium]|nr:Pyruvate dehydrogenase E1 component subunit beta [Chlamydiales bacterium]MCH9635068.1 Pyruvate dehydrogenase E1 component subunit beta [Chlamydiales bacterium]MCH9703639.1 alpha-ketoacid dehydrogenase subunit beta [Chlamydiota bacterium]
MRDITFAQAILEAQDQLLAADESVYLMGLGVPDPKGIFGTTVGLVEKYGPDRVQDMPISENAITGIGVGSAIVGMRPVMTHQRVDFFLLAMDQLINNASKWHYMFGNKMQVPIVFRLVMGRGWGQGPQHCQSLHSIFAHIPGLKVVMPSTPYDAKGLLVSAVEDNEPVVFMEHRWLHNIHGDVPDKMYRVPIGKAKVVQEGSDLTIVASSHMTLEAFRALKMIDGSVELIDLRSVKPLDKETILNSVRKTGRLLVADPDWKTCGFGAEVIAMVTEEAFSNLKMAPRRVAYPDRHSPTSWALSNHYYPTDKDVAIAALEMLGKQADSKRLLQSLLETRMGTPMDVPDQSFTGPF